MCSCLSRSIYSLRALVAVRPSTLVQRGGGVTMEACWLDRESLEAGDAHGAAQSCLKCDICKKTPQESGVRQACLHLAFYGRRVR